MARLVLNNDQKKQIRDTKKKLRAEFKEVYGELKNVKLKLITLENGHIVCLTYIHTANDYHNYGVKIVNIDGNLIRTV